MSSTTFTYSNGTTSTSTDITLTSSSYTNTFPLVSAVVGTVVTSLGGSCFYGCTSLSSVTIPSSVTSLGVLCFYDCTSLTSVTIPSSVTSLPNYLFQNCTGLLTVTIPSSVTSLGNYCFNNCTSLQSLPIPSSVTSLGQACFDTCTSLTSITIPSSVTSLSYGCFYRCQSLTSFIIPSSVTSIGAFCFGSTNFNRFIIINQRSLTSCGSNVFFNCVATNVTFYNTNSYNDLLSAARSLVAQLPYGSTITYIPTPITPTKKFTSSTRLGIGSNSYGQFWYGNATNFPGFLYKKNLGVGGRRSTKMNPGGNTTCNKTRHLYNNYRPGTGGVGASNTSNRRAKNRLATVCGVQNQCGQFYNYLGLYDKYTGNPNGYFVYPPNPNGGSAIGTYISPAGFSYSR